MTSVIVPTILRRHLPETLSRICLGVVQYNTNTHKPGVAPLFQQITYDGFTRGCDWPIKRSCVTSIYGLSLTFMCQKTLDIVFQTPFAETSHLGWKPPD